MNNKKLINKGNKEVNEIQDQIVLIHNECLKVSLVREKEGL